MRQLKADGYGVERLFRCLLLPFMEDLSDREMEPVPGRKSGRQMVLWSSPCPSPRRITASSRASALALGRLDSLSYLRRCASGGFGLMSEVFTFVDATHLITSFHAVVGRTG
ncbi:MAG: hypothetical protein R3B95_09005 [Nitrospirales bacterium]|nr:hypothetical protein [Nitrospirales bacterium]